MGLFGFGETKREKVKKIREEERKQLLKYRREERGRVAEERELKSKTRLEKQRAAHLEAKARRRKAQVESFPYTFPSITIGKKKQGKKLSRKKRITLL